MTDLSTAPRARLFTTWGTVLYVDAGSGELKHGAIESSPENAVFVANPSSVPACRQGWLMRNTGEDCEPIVCRSDRCQSISDVEGDPGSAGATPLEVISLERGLIALRAGGLFLCAESNGRITLSRTVCSLWECFLPSADFCTAPLAAKEAVASAFIDWPGIRSFVRDRKSMDEIEKVVDGTPVAERAAVTETAFERQAFKPVSRMRKPVTRVLFFTGTGWAFGSVHFELVKYLHSRGRVADVLDFGHNYNREELAMMGEYYDCIVGIVGEAWPLTEEYGIPHEKIVVVAHGDYDIHHALETRPRDEFERFGGYAVISEYLRELSSDLGIQRVPKIVKYGINYRRFLTPVASELKIVGYGGRMFRDDNGGVDWKRGVLAREATEAAGLVFRPAGQFHFLAMPRYYQQVDAVLVTSSREGFGLPAMEAAAAGRLVISTPVGGFPYLASVGAGITAPVRAAEYKEFVIEKLNYYKDNPREYVETCESIQHAARKIDWEYTIDAWIELIETVGH